MNIRIRGIILLFLLLIGQPLQGQTHEEYQDKEYKKKGWNFSPLPSVGYDSDLGFQLGAYLELYNFGDGSIYPDYLHKFIAQASYFTKGSGTYHLQYDSKYLFPGLRFTASASYLPSTMMNFYGFNGYVTPYSAELKNEYGAFYNIKRNMLRLMINLQGEISGNFQWAAGISFFSYDTGVVKQKKYRDQPSLFRSYVEEGIIRDNEKKGGNHIELRFGIVYDSRDHEPDPARGIFSYAILYGSPDMIGRDGYSYLKCAATFNNYIPLAGKKLTLAYRISYQGTVAGDVPFYVQQNYTMLYLTRINTDILGGGFSLRGVNSNRIVGNGMAWGNVELRWRFFRFKLIKQEWYMVLNPFFDAGMAVQSYRLTEIKNSADPRIYQGQGESLHMSAGLAARLVMNSNFVVGADYGIPFDKRDGKGGLYLNVNYIF